LVSKSGKIIPGDTHPTAREHGELIKSHLATHPSAKAEDLSHYAVGGYDGKQHMFLKTKSKAGAAGMVKAFDKLPHHSSDLITHDHYEKGKIQNPGATPIKRARVYQNLRRYASVT
jgi:hypothetical protein